MNIVNHDALKVSRRRSTTRDEWVGSSLMDHLQLWFPTLAWGRIARWTRWLLAMGPLLALLALSRAWQPVRYPLLDFDGPAPNRPYVDPGVLTQAASLLPVIVVAASLPAFLYLARHVPVPGHYPNCTTCAREQETLHCILENRQTCRRCGRSLQDLIEQDVRSARRRASWSW